MNELKKNSEHILEIAEQGINGEGIARYGGKVIFVSGALKGERVRTLILQEKKDYCHAKAVEIIKRADFRIEPICPSFPVCGGCNLLHMKYDKQLELKKQNLENTLRKILKCGFIIDEPVPSPNKLYYRNKIKAPIGKGKNGESVIGFFAPRSHRLVPFKKCYIQKEIHEAAIDAVKEFAECNKADIYDEETRKGNLRFVTVQDFAGAVIVTIIAAIPKKLNFTVLDAVLKKAYKNNYALYCSKNTNEGNVIQGESLVFLGGKDVLKEDVSGITLQFHPFAFRQVNDEIKTMLYNNVVELCKESSVVIDAFSGGGLMSMLLAKNAEIVYAVEIDKNACESARLAASENNINNIKIICGDCKTELPKIEKELSTVQKQTLSLILDPPRTGCDKEVLSCVKNLKPQKLIYISCNPATLARDLSIICDGEEVEFNIKTIRPFDMFPQTSHLETLVFLERK